VDEEGRTVADGMLTAPVRHPVSATVRELRRFFRDDHVQAALIVSPDGYLQAVVERDDIAGCRAAETAAPLGRLAGRTVRPEAGLAATRRAMISAGRRRAAVTSADGRLLGLLCLKASRSGFCSAEDVRARAGDQAGEQSAGQQAGAVVS
jgi:hypothetical protein